MLACPIGSRLSDVMPAFLEAGISGRANGTLPNLTFCTPRDPGRIGGHKPTCTNDLSFPISRLFAAPIHNTIGGLSFTNEKPTSGLYRALYAPGIAKAAAHRPL
jgi:hypothetical protein